MHFAAHRWLVWLVFLTMTGFSVAMAAEPLQYDVARQAIVVDPYFDDFGGQIEIDFNGDHSWAGIIDQSLWHYL